MQLEKMTKIPDLLDLVRLSEKAENCWIKYEYLFHLVKMSDSVLDSFKVGDSSDPDNAELSYECDESDYEHTAYSPRCSARWSSEEPSEYFVVAGKKPLSLVFKRSRSNSPVLKPKCCNSPSINNKIPERKLILECEPFDCRRNTSPVKLVAKHGINCSCGCVNSTQCICTCKVGNAGKYPRGSASCSEKETLKDGIVMWPSEKCLGIDDNKIHDPGLLFGDERATMARESALESEMYLPTTVDIMKPHSQPVNCHKNTSTEGVNDSSAKNRTREDDMSEIPSRANTYPESVADTVFRGIDSLQIGMSLQSTSFDHGNHKRKVCSLDDSVPIFKDEEIQNSETTCEVAVNSDLSLLDSALKNSLALIYLNNAVNGGPETLLRPESIPSDKAEVGGQSKFSKTADGGVCSDEVDTAIQETFQHDDTASVAASHDKVELPEMFVRLQVGEGSCDDVAGHTSTLQEHCADTSDLHNEATVMPLEGLAPSKPNIEFSALIPTDFIPDVQLNAGQTVSVVDYISVDSATVLSPVLVPACQERVRESGPVPAVQNCSATDSARGSAFSRREILGEVVTNDSGCSKEIESQLMDHDSYEAVGSVEVLEHVRNPIDISPECMNSDVEFEILEVKGRAAHCSVATASHNLFPWDSEKDGSFSFPGDELQNDVEMVTGGSQLHFDVPRDGPAARSLAESSCSESGPPFSNLSNDPFICGLSHNSDDELVSGVDCASEVGNPSVGRSEDTENACDRFLFEDKSECGAQIDAGQFLCPVDVNGALPFGEVEDRAFFGVGTADGAAPLEANGSGWRTWTQRAPAQEGSRGRGVGPSRRAGRKKQQMPECNQKSSSCESSQVYGFSEETMDRIFDDSSGDVYKERSPLLYSSDEEKLCVDVEDDRTAQHGSLGALGQCHEKKRLNRLQELISGVPPPPTVTYPQFCVGAMAARLRGFCVACPEGASRVFRGRSQNSVGEEVAKQTQWPDSRFCSYHGISYNNGRLSEEMELLSQKLCQRYVGSETTSSLVGVPPAPVLCKGGASQRRSSRDKGHSPGSRLSHLARRRHTFSSSNLLAPPATDKRIILVDPRSKDHSKSRATSSKRSGPELGKVSAPNTKNGKRSLFQTPPNKGGPDVSKVSVNTSKPTRRALFNSPSAAQQSSGGRDLVTPEASRRALWPATGALHGIENCAKEAGKRSRSSDGWETQAMNAKYLRRSSRTPTKGSENRGKTGQNNLSSPHRKKLLWAVAESLRSAGVGLQHPRFRTCAAALARLCRDLLLAQPAAPPRAGSTSEHMLRLANKHVRQVIRARPA